MRRKISILAVLLLALVAVPGALAGCGGEEEEPLLAEEGEPLELGSLLFNVQLTRYLNPDSEEDRAYLRGLEPAPPGQTYLAVFMRISNESDEAQRVPFAFSIRDTRDEVFLPIVGESSFALDLGSEIPAESQIPADDTPAASGPIKGSMVLFLISDASIENRPLELEIPGPGEEVGEIELDI